jgi:hypothetical protein
MLSAELSSSMVNSVIRITGFGDHDRPEWLIRISGIRDKARQAYVRIAGFLAGLRVNAEQLDPLARWYRILSEALQHFLHGRQLQPPLRLAPT